MSVPDEDEYWGPAPQRVQELVANRQIHKRSANEEVKDIGPYYVEETEMGRSSRWESSSVQKLEERICSASNSQVPKSKRNLS